jgi:hypothetical protein
MKGVRTLRCLDCCPTRLRGAHMECSTCGALLCAMHRVVVGSTVYCNSCAANEFLRRRNGVRRAIA